MRLVSIRLIISLIVGITLVSLSYSYYEALGEKRSLRRDLERRAEVLGQSVAGSVERDLEKNSLQDLQHIVQHFGNREHLLGLAIYGPEGQFSGSYTGAGIHAGYSSFRSVSSVARESRSRRVSTHGRCFAAHLRSTSSPAR